MPSPFSNEIYLNFNEESHASAMQAAIKQVESYKDRSWDLLINGQWKSAEKTITSVNPAAHQERVGQVASANQNDAEAAIQAADKAFNDWKKVSVLERANYLFRAAAAMRERRYEFAAGMVLEAGKSWNEADADVAEAIDFMEFYGRQAIEWDGVRPLTPYPGELNETFYIPLGVGLVIPPWNFPVAILVGMTTAALVTGNTVVLKPASVTPVVAAMFVELMQSLGLPDGVLNFVPGSGAEIGDHMVQHPRVRFISFTGSKEVGLRINKLAAQISPGQKWIKRVVAEMGGKDTIIASDCADKEALIDGIVAAAYGYSGQKCSACSRAVIHQKIYDEIVEGVAAKAKTLKIGDPRDFGNFTGPVSSDDAYEKIMSYVEIGKGEGRLLTGGQGDNSQGYFIEPTVIADVDPQARISQEEIFGPVLAMFKAKDFDQALEIANNTDYGLTGAAYASSQSLLQKAREEFHVGNLYLNRKCTGALVDVHPFGGFNMSGTDSKAGGREYLALFMQAKSVALKL